MDKVLTEQLESIASTDWGTYYLNRYYFSIQTKWVRSAAGFNPEHRALSKEVQNKLQQENLPAIFHEFFHYIHDVSTILSSAIFQNRIAMLSIFTGYLEKNPASAVSLGTDTNFDLVTKFINCWQSNEALTGSTDLEFPMRKIERIAPGKKEVHFPLAPQGKQNGAIPFPEITYSGYLNGKPAKTMITLGRFYLFEFLAYEMDQILDKRQKKLDKIEDPLRFTEYTVCRMIALEIFPDVKQEIAMAAGLLALEHIDGGNAFISILQRIGNAFYNGIGQEVTLSEIKNEVKQVLIKQRANFFAQQDEYVKAFAGRHQLEIAYTYLADVSKTLYDKRIDDLCFELDWLLKGEYGKILKTAAMCDYLYKFLPDTGSDDPEFDRDFMATILPDQISVAMKALVGFDHYFLSHRGGMSTALVERFPQKNHCCPFYTCCDLQDRKDNPEICENKPWRIYEVQFNRDKKYCWYATGVLEAKGESIRRN
ncbi:hypothetical protein [Mucilaginibacter paludis]|uniref:Uncharacterized protein n=1 Tax=Mucilaginibacter paludis DSM 18603 TaxID=714943 RepID=H1YCV3_9SPHI|nr:hypothetical protein [Mucilaginibacter paludis]EHQ25124.1 hypothetical protein Mucpa_0948 [Mucilaginibacter paludis DSM 18603]